MNLKIVILKIKIIKSETFLYKYKKSEPLSLLTVRFSYTLQMAGVTGIEPALMVLETTVLPLYDTPKQLGSSDF